jgi:hypothetical protein
LWEITTQYQEIESQARYFDHFFSKIGVSANQLKHEIICFDIKYLSSEINIIILYSLKTWWGIGFDISKTLCLLLGVSHRLMERVDKRMKESSKNHGSEWESMRYRIFWIHLLIKCWLVFGSKRFLSHKRYRRCSDEDYWKIMN